MKNIVARFEFNQDFSNILESVIIGVDGYNEREVKKMGEEITLKKARILNGHTRKSFAKLMNISESSVQKYEEGKTDIPATKLKKWGESTGFSINSLALPYSTEK